MEETESRPEVIGLPRCHAASIGKTRRLASGDGDELVLLPVEVDAYYIHSGSRTARL